MLKIPQEKIFLIRKVILGSKLPSLRDCFSWNSDESQNTDDEKDTNVEKCPLVGPSGIQTATKSIMTLRLSAALDKCKVSKRVAVHLLTAFMESVSQNSADYIFNRTSIRNMRQSYREESATKLRSKFSKLNVEFVIVHWDIKLLPDKKWPRKSRSSTDKSNFS